MCRKVIPLPFRLLTWKSSYSSNGLLYATQEAIKISIIVPLNINFRRHVALREKANQKTVNDACLRHHLLVGNGAELKRQHWAVFQTWLGDLLFISVITLYMYYTDRLCGLVVRAPGYKSRGPGFDSRRYQIFWEIVGLERGPLSLMSTTEELPERKK
jgi:hypothetical protein